MHNCLWFQTLDLPVEGMRDKIKGKKKRRRKRRAGQGSEVAEMSSLKVSVCLGLLGPREPTPQRSPSAGAPAKAEPRFAREMEGAMQKLPLF